MESIQLIHYEEGHIMTVTIDEQGQAQEARECRE